MTLRPFRILVVAAALAVAIVAPARAQDPPPKIGPFVLDLHGTVARFPREQPLAQSRVVKVEELPGTGLGLHGGVHVYVLTIKPVTIGLGVDATVARAHQPARLLADNTLGRAVTERFTHVAPEISFNFGNGDGWSYISGGIGPGIWSVQAEGGPTLEANSERLKTINYGGGARWFMKRHLAFSFDVRFYAVNPGTPRPDLAVPGGPRKTLRFMGAGISLK